MKQLKVKEIIARIEEKEELRKNRAEKERKEPGEMRPTAAAASTNSSTSNPGVLTEKEVGKDDVLGSWTVKRKDGRHLELRNSLCNNKKVMKNAVEKPGKGARKKTAIQEMINKFGGGDGKGPSDRSELKKSESEGKKEDNWLGFGRQKDESVMHQQVSEEVIL